MTSYKELIVWQKSLQLVIEIYTITSAFPAEEKFGLISQMRRCSLSIISNIAEEFARKNKRENAQFVNIAYGSATELETQLIISRALRFLHDTPKTRADSLLDEILRMLYRYRESLSK